MAELNARIIAKASATTGEEPVAGDLEVAELAVNTADGKLFTKHTDNSIVTISGSGGGGGAVDSVNGQTGAVELDLEDLENVKDVGTGLIAGGLVLLAEGSDGATATSTGLDSSAFNRTQFGSSNLPTYSTSVFKYGTSSFSFNNDGLAFPNNTDGLTNSLLTDDFTVETWVYFNATSTAYIFMDGNYYNNDYTCSLIASSGLGSFEMYYSATGSSTLGPVSFSGTTLSTGQWYHVALCRSGNDFRLFVDGTQYGSTFSYSGSLNANTSSHWIGLGRNFSGSVVDRLNGYIDEYRVVASALYTADFTPSAITADPVLPDDGQVLTWVDANSRWEPVNASGASTLDDLTDVDTSTTAPTDGQALTWVAANNQWEPADASGGGGAVDSVAGKTGAVTLEISDNTDVLTKATYSQSGGTAAYSVSGNATGYVQRILLNSDRLVFANGDVTPGSTLEYLRDTAVLPFTIQTYVDGVLSTDATVTVVDTTSDPSALWITADWTDAEVNAASTFFIEATADPTDGQILTWVAANDQWEPADAASVNGQTGVISLGIQNMDDFALNQAPPPGSYEFTSYADGAFSIPNEDYEWGVQTGELRIWRTAADGTDLRSVFDTLPATGSVWWSSDGISFTEATYTSLIINNDGTAGEYLRLLGTSPLPTTLSGSLFVQFTQPGAPTDIPLADGDILQWDSAEQEFRPETLPDATATRALLGIGEYADDAAAGTGGVASGAMYYNTTSSDYRLKT